MTRRVFKPTLFGMLMAAATSMLLMAGTAMPAEPDVTADQQQQLTQLQHLKAQIQNDRAAVHGAVGKYGFDSGQVDAAREQLFRDRAEYRQMRRSLVAAGVTVRPLRRTRLRRPTARPCRFSPLGRAMTRARGRCRCPYAVR